MSNQSAKFAAAIAVCVLASLALRGVSRAANAADDCLTEPSGPTSQGKHWYYHIERSTGRHCWYQRGQDDTAANSSAQDQSATTNDDAAPTTDQALSTRDQAAAAKPPAKKIATTPATRSIADARAELPARPRVQDDSNTAPATTVAPPAQPNAANASVWPDPRAAIGAKPAAVDTSSAPASDNTDTQADTTASITPAPAPSPAPVTQAGPLGDRHLGSIPMLLLVAFGALGLAGLTGSTVYRLASAGRRVRPEDRWSRNVNLQPAPTARRPRPIPVRPEPIQETFEHQETFEAQDALGDDVEPEQIAHAPVEREPVEQERFEPPKRERFELRVEVPRTEMPTSEGNRKREQIEAYLAQLTRQLQADLDLAARAE